MIAVMFGASMLCCYFFELQHAAGSHHFAAEGFEKPFPQPGDGDTDTEGGLEPLDEASDSQASDAERDDAPTEVKPRKNGSHRRLSGSGSADDRSDAEQADGGADGGGDGSGSGSELETVPLSDGVVAQGPAAKHARNGRSSAAGSQGGSGRSLSGGLHGSKEGSGNIAGTVTGSQRSLARSHISGSGSHRGATPGSTRIGPPSSANGDSLGLGSQQGSKQGGLMRVESLDATDMGTDELKGSGMGASADGAAPRVVVVGSVGDVGEEAPVRKKKRRKKRKRRKGKKGKEEATRGAVPPSFTPGPLEPLPEPDAGVARLVHLEPLMQPPQGDRAHRVATTEVVPASERLLAGLGRGASAAWGPLQPEVEKAAPGFWEASDRPSNLVQCSNSCVCCLAVVILVVALTVASSPAGGGTPDAVAPVIAMCCLIMAVAGVGIIGACGYCCDLLPTAGTCAALIEMRETGCVRVS